MPRDASAERSASDRPANAAPADDGPVSRRAVDVDDSEEAVSPVIGVILMVAITVVLAAVVFVLVSNLGGDSKSAASFKLQKDESSDRLKVISSETNANWKNLAIRADKTGTEFMLNAATGATGGSNGVITNAETNYAVTATSNPMGASEYVELCGAAAAVTDVTFTIVDTAANQILGEYTFSSVALCA